jgi:hypothetical protein
MAEKHSVKGPHGFQVKRRDETQEHGRPLLRGIYGGAATRYQLNVEAAEVNETLKRQVELFRLVMTELTTDPVFSTHPAVGAVLETSVGKLYRSHLLHNYLPIASVHGTEPDFATGEFLRFFCDPASIGSFPVEASAVVDVMKAESKVHDMMAAHERDMEIAQQQAKEAKMARRRRVVGMWADIKQGSVEIQQELRKDWA